MMLFQCVRNVFGSVLVVMLAFAVAPSFAVEYDHVGSTVSMRIDQGEIKGRLQNGVAYFYGIPYAHDPSRLSADLKHHSPMASGRAFWKRQPLHPLYPNQGEDKRLSWWGCLEI